MMANSGQKFRYTCIVSDRNLGVVMGNFGSCKRLPRQVKSHTFRPEFRLFCYTSVRQNQITYVTIIRNQNFECTVNSLFTTFDLIIPSHVAQIAV